MKEKFQKFVTLLCGIFFLVGCKAPIAQQSGREDIAYLLFISPKQYAGKEVTVTLDTQTPFQAKVIKEKFVRSKGKQYGIHTGKRRIKVVYKGKTLYEKYIFVSSQEIKQILLP